MTPHCLVSVCKEGSSRHPLEQPFCLTEVWHSVAPTSVSFFMAEKYAFVQCHIEENDGTGDLSSLVDTQAHEERQHKQRYMVCQPQS